MCTTSMPVFLCKYADFCVSVLFVEIDVGCVCGGGRGGAEMSISWSDNCRSCIECEECSVWILY